MKFIQSGFRAIYRQFCAFELSDELKSMMSDFPNFEEANCMLTYGFIEPAKGLMLQVVALGKKNDNAYTFFSSSENKTVQLGIEAVKDTEFTIMQNADDHMNHEYEDQLTMLHAFDVPPEIEQVRTMIFLDASRDHTNPDNIKVKLFKKDFEPETVWAKTAGIGDSWFVGTLLEEPKQKLGYHKGDMIAFFVEESDTPVENDIDIPLPEDIPNLICVADLNPDKTFTEDELAGGEILNAAISKFLADQKNENFVEVVQLLRDSHVWVPCTAVLSDEDQAKIETAIDEAKLSETGTLIGAEFTTDEDVRLIPDILQNGEMFFLPVFSNAAEMGDYGKKYSQIEMSFIDAIGLAMACNPNEFGLGSNSDQVKGIVVNPFGENFVLDGDLFEPVLGLKSRIAE